MWTTTEIQALSLWVFRKEYSNLTMNWAKTAARVLKTEQTH